MNDLYSEIINLSIGSQNGNLVIPEEELKPLLDDGNENNINLLFYVGSKFNKLKQFPNATYCANDVIKIVKDIEDKIIEHTS